MNINQRDENGNLHGLWITLNLNGLHIFAYYVHGRRRGLARLSDPLTGYVVKETFHLRP
jgi:hypothetical protein